MALTVNHPLGEHEHAVNIASLGATPTVGYMHASRRGQLTGFGVIQSGAVTGTATVTVAVNGTAVGTLAVTGGSAGSVFTGAPASPTFVNEDDVITFTPAGATGTVYGTGFAKLKAA